MDGVQVGQRSYEMPSRNGISIAYAFTLKDIEQSARCYERVFGGSVLSFGDGNAPGYLHLSEYLDDCERCGRPTPEKPAV
jgi:hypothetical protein